MASNCFPFLKIGQTNVVFHMFGTSPVSYDFLKISVRIDDTFDESSFKTLRVLLFGPAAFFGFKLWSSLATPFSVI